MSCSIVIPGSGMSSGADPAVGADDHVLDVVHPLGRGVHHGVHLARGRVDLGVRGERARKRAEEVVAADGLELVGQLDRAPARLDHRPRGAGEPADVGVGAARVVAPVRAGDVGLAAVAATLAEPT
jgi:hypothetical protein